MRHIYTKLSLLLLGSILGISQLFAQVSKPTNYFNQVGEYSSIYSGEIESPYSFVRYNNFPYYRGVDYATGEISFKGHLYPELKIRLDLYKEAVVVLTPDKQFAKIVPLELINYLKIYNRKFVNNSPLNKALPGGLLMLIVDKEEIKLIEKYIYTLDTAVVGRKNSFSPKISYYLLLQEKVYPVKGKKEIINLFPSRKKEIKQYIRKENLNFRGNKENDLAMLVEFCSQWVDN